MVKLKVQKEIESLKVEIRSFNAKTQSLKLQVKVKIEIKS